MLFHRDVCIPCMDPSPSIRLSDLARGDEAAWKAAYPELYRQAWIVAKARLRSGLGVDIEGLASSVIADEVMPGLKKMSAQSFKDLRNFDDLIRLVRKIAAYRAISQIRWVQRRKEEEMPEDWDLPQTVETGQDHGNEDFWLLVGTLKPPKPELFADYFLGDLKYPEIAEKHSMPLGSVCSHFKRGLDELRARLTKRTVDKERGSE